MTTKNRRKNFEFSNLIGFDWTLVVLISLLSLFGLAILASSLSNRTEAEYQSILFRQLFFGFGIGVFGAVVIANFDYHFWLDKYKILLILNYFFLIFLGLFSIFIFLQTLGQTTLASNTITENAINNLSFLPIKPHVANGAIRWIDLPLLPNFQPSELSKIAILIYFSYFFSQNDISKLTWLKLKRPLYTLIFTSFLIIIQPDLGTTALIFGIVISCMWVVKVPFKILTTILITSLSIVIFLIISVGYRVDRFNAYLDINSDSATQIRGVQQAISSGGFWGKGYGNSQFKQEPGRLFEQSTDAIIAIIGEEFGYLGMLILFTLYFLILKRGLKIAEETEDNGGKSLATGIVFWLTIQAIINIFGMLGLMPLKGIPLPFISLGGTSVMINLFAIGLLLSVSKYK